MKLEKLVESLEGARKEVTRINLLSSKLSKFNKEDLPEGFTLELEKAVNGFSKMIIAIYKEIDFKVPYTKYTDKNAGIFFKGVLAMSENHNYDTEMSRLVGSLNMIANLVRKLNSDEHAREYQNIVTKQNTFVGLKKAYFTAQGLTLEGIETAIAMFIPEVSDEASEDTVDAPSDAESDDTATDDTVDAPADTTEGESEENTGEGEEK